MRCQKCSFKNVPTAHFCGECGQSLSPQVSQRDNTPKDSTLRSSGFFLNQRNSSHSVVAFVLMALFACLINYLSWDIDLRRQFDHFFVAWHLLALPALCLSWSSPSLNSREGILLLEGIYWGVCGAFIIRVRLSWITEFFYFPSNRA